MDFKQLILKFKNHDQKPEKCVCLRCEFALAEKPDAKLAFNDNAVMRYDFCDFLHTNFELFKKTVLNMPKKSNYGGLFSNTRQGDTNNIDNQIISNSI